MNKKSLSILKEAISTAGKWTYWETSNDSFTLEFEDVQLYDHFLDELDTFSSIISLRFSSNAFLSFFDNNGISSNYSNNYSSSDYWFNNFIISDSPFKLNSCSFDFQNFDLINNIKNRFTTTNNFLDNSNSESNLDVDYILAFCSNNSDNNNSHKYNKNNVAVVCGANNIECIDSNGILSDNDIKNRSNRWIIYCIDYWKNKNNNKKSNNYNYNLDNACEYMHLIKNNFKKYNLEK